MKSMSQPANTMAGLPLTGTQHEIAAGDYRATITQLGAGLRRLQHRDVPLISEYEPDQVPPGAAGELLIPWPNRVDGGRYAFGGRQFQLDITEPAHGNAIHGLTRWAAWQPTAADHDHVELGLRLLGSPGYPFCLELQAGYRLTAEGGLHVTVTASNAGQLAAPYGTGSHPYLRVGPGPVDDWALRLPAARWLATDERGIPAGQPQDVTGTEFDFTAGRRIGGTSLDHAFTGLARDASGRTWAGLTGPDGAVALWAGTGYDWLQVFTADTLGEDRRRAAVAVEPMTCPPNALASGIDLLTLAPGQTVTNSWGLTVVPS
jgi:aldose 1-epimerase